MVSVDVGKFKRKDPETATEHVHKFVLEHKFISGFSVGLFLLAIFFRVIPISWLNLLPSWAGRGVLFLFLANTIAFLPARWLYNKIQDPPIDIIYETDITAEQPIKQYYYYEGLFKENFDFKAGSPIEWISNKGITTYTVIKLEDSQNVAYCSFMGDLNDLELMRTKEMLKAQRLWNDELRKFGSQLYLKWDQIVSKIEYQATNQYLRMLNDIAHPDEITSVVEKELPRDVEEQTAEIDLDQILDEANVNTPDEAKDKLGLEAGADESE